MSVVPESVGPHTPSAEQEMGVDWYNAMEAMTIESSWRELLKHSRYAENGFLLSKYNDARLNGLGNRTSLRTSLNKTPSFSVIP